MTRIRQPLADAVGGLREPGAFVGVELLRGDGRDQPRQLNPDHGTVVGREAPRKLVEQLEEAVDDLGVRGAVSAGLRDGQLNEVSEGGAMDDDPYAPLVVAA